MLFRKKREVGREFENHFIRENIYTRIPTGIDIL